MIRLTVELISATDGHREILGTADIFNDGTGTKTRGNYGFRIWGKKRPGLILREGRIENHSRMSGVWHLVARVLGGALYLRGSMDAPATGLHIEEGVPETRLEALTEASEAENRATLPPARLPAHMAPLRRSRT